jgi:phage shock protein PspC (stress-responsive transcriptional regulator)
MNDLFRSYGLYRDPARGWFAGVAAGLAERFGITDVAARLVFVLLAIAATPILALIVYAALAIFMPVRPALFDARAERRWRDR